MMSFPSSSKLKDVFLDFFQTRKKLYEFAMERVIPEHVISVDHTFKVGKNIGGYRGLDGRFIKGDKKLFIVLDEYLRIAAWKLTKSTGHEEIQDKIRELSERCKEIFMVLTDNCCQDRDFYLEFFINALVKLDIFHGVQRVTNTIPTNKFSPETAKFVSDFGLVFRENGDVEKARQKATPVKQTILANLDAFLERNSSFIDKLTPRKKDDFAKQIELLRRHIEKDCLSGIGVGHGTEGNESLHRLLNRSCLRGA